MTIKQLAELLLSLPEDQQNLEAMVDVNTGFAEENDYLPIARVRHVSKPRRYSSEKPNTMVLEEE